MLSERRQTQRILTALFQNIGKLHLSHKKSEHSCGAWSGMQTAVESRELSGGMAMFYTLFGMVDTQLYTIIRTYHTQYSRFIHLIAC